MKVLRPQLTLEQVMRLPDPVIPHPYREIEVSRPDPNMFLEHEDGVTEHNTEIHNHVIHNYEQRQAAMESGVPLDILQGAFKMPRRVWQIQRSSLPRDLQKVFLLGCP